MIAEFLQSNEEDAEIWIVDVIRQSKIEAKIDSEKGVIYVQKKSN